MKHSYVYRQQNGGGEGIWRYFCMQICLKHECIETKRGKAIPVQAWAGPEGSRRLRLPDYRTVVT
jgi:hypothetical protein